MVMESSKAVLLVLMCLYWLLLVFMTACQKEGSRRHCWYLVQKHSETKEKKRRSVQEWRYVCCISQEADPASRTPCHIRQMPVRTRADRVESAATCFFGGLYVYATVRDTNCSITSYTNSQSKISLFIDQQSKTPHGFTSIMASSDDRKNNDPPAPEQASTSSSSSNHHHVTSSHYEAHADKNSYEKAYFYEPGAYMEHLVKLTVDRMGLQQLSTTINVKLDGCVGPCRRRRHRILDIGGGTGNFSQALVDSVAKSDFASSDNLEIVVVDPYLDPSTGSSTTESASSKNVSFVRAGAEAFLEDIQTEEVVDNSSETVSVSSWRLPGSYHQILMKEIIHHLDAKDRVAIFRGMHRGLAPLLANSNSDRSSDKEEKDPIPSMLIVTRPQVEIDYPLWDEARQVWKENQPSVQEIVHDLQEAGFQNITHTIESYPCSIALDRWQSMIRERFWSTFSNFSDAELDDACRRIAKEHKARVDKEGNIHFEDRLVFLSACN